MDTHDNPTDQPVEPVVSNEPPVAAPEQFEPKQEAVVFHVKESRLNKIKQKPVIFGLSAGILLLIIGVVGFALNNKKDAPVATSNQSQQQLLGASVSLVDGKVQTSSDGETWADAAVAATVDEGDYLRSEPGARAIVTFDDGSIIRLNESTTVRFVSLDAQDISIKNVAGEVYSRVVASDRTFRVDVEGTDYTALGTAFKTVNSDTDKGVQVYHSAVAVKDVADKVAEGKQFFKKNVNPELVDKQTDVPVDEMKSDAFTLWNFEEDKKSSEFKDKLGYLKKIEEQAAAAQAPASTASTNGIKLTGSVVNNEVVLKWSLSGVSAPDGFKIVRSKKTETPTFGKDEAHYVSDKSARSHNWGESGAGTYNYRVCTYIPSQSTCTNYSNTVKLDTPEKLPTLPAEGTVTLSNTGLQFMWTDSANSAPHGWKLVWSTSQNPVYGAAGTDNRYLDKKKYTFESDELPSGTYYMRICKYTASSHSGGCMNYSNQVEYIVP